MAVDEMKVSSVESRKIFLSDMHEFIQKECAEIGEILADLSWTPDYIMKKRGIMVQCPYDQNHLIPKQSQETHAKSCQLRKAGLSDKELELQLQNDDFFYTKSDLVGKVQLDEGLVNRIIWNSCMEKKQMHLGHRDLPVGVDDWFIKLTPQERLAIYDHCVQTLKAQGKMANVERDETLTTDWERIIKKGMLENMGEKPKTEAELHAMLRDQKRRRQSYRAKNVHVTKKSYTEIIREVIINQMEILMPSSQGPKQSQESSSLERESSSGDVLDQMRKSQLSSHRDAHRRERSRSHSLGRRRRSRSRSPGYREGPQSWKHNKHSHRGRSRSGSPRKRERTGASLGKKHTQLQSGNDSPYVKTSKRENVTTYEDDSHQTESIQTSLQTVCQTPEAQLQRHNDSYDEGEVLSDDSSSHRTKHKRFKKKSSKHKKHKHKKSTKNFSPESSLS